MNSSASHPILSCAEAKAWEHHRLGGDPERAWAAMQRAGAAVARGMIEDFREIGGLPPRARLLVLAGKGHNGGDALLAAKTILELHPEARAAVLLCFDESQLRPLAQRAYLTLGQAAPGRVETVPWLALKDRDERYDLCVDGVFGFQFRPPMDAATAEVLMWANTHASIRVRAAVDLPSGLAEEGASTVFQADFTYATGIVKKPVVDPANLGHVGRPRYLDLGFFEAAAHPEGSPYQVGRGVLAEPSSVNRVLLASILQPLAQLRPALSDKRTYGHLFVVGGSRSYPGAVLMTVQAALRSGVGLLTAFVPASLAPEYAARFPEAMWVGCPETKAGGLAGGTVALLRERLARATALAVGPGLGAEAGTLAAVQEIVAAAGVPVLLDADALRPEVLAAARGKRLVCTPHAGEFQRIADGVRLEDYCASNDAVIVLKGPMTRIACGRAGLRPAPEGGSKTRPTETNVYFSFFGGPVLARGGSGDVLAGLIGGLLAQHGGPSSCEAVTAGDQGGLAGARPSTEATLLAACRGVVWHGMAADLLARDRGQVAVQTTQLFDYLQSALKASL